MVTTVPLQRASVFIKCLMIFVISMGPLIQQPILGQTKSMKQTEAELKNLFGLDKLKALNQLSDYYDLVGSRKSVKYGRQAVALGEDLFSASNTAIDRNERGHLLQAYFQLGKVLYGRKDYLGARKNLKSAKTLSQVIEDATYLEEIENYLSKIQALIDSGEVKDNIFSKALSDLKVGQAISNTTKDIAIQSEIKLGESNEKNGDFSNAIKHYEKAENLLRNKGEAQRVSEMQRRIAVLLDSLNQHEEAQIVLSEAIIEIEQKKPIPLPTLETDIPIVTAKKGVEPEVIDQSELKVEQKNLKDLSESFAREKNFEKSLAYYKLYQELTQKMETDSLQAVVENQQREGEMLLLKQQKEIADLNVAAVEQEKERQIRLRNTSALIGLMVLFTALVTFYYYMNKRREHKKLTITHRDLKKTKSKLEDAEQRIVSLLTQQVSGDIAQQLIMNSADTPIERRFVCILFLDIRNFTPMAEKLSPEQLIAFQNKTFGFMIDAIQQYNGIINQLLGDGFMATFGAPVSHGNDCQNAYLAAREILKELKDRNEAGLLKNIRIGIGLHAGHVVTGNVGNASRKQYSVTGNTVIIASRVEQLNKEYKSQLIMTEEVIEKLDQRPALKQAFTEVKVKGRSKPVKILMFD